MQFDRLRLSGFKSFVEATELIIEPGMTGIVGPNGCGKSNLVEALRWVMGETSAKSMRGGAMDDVIFGGSSQRPSRNVAEVSLRLLNDDRSAPPAFNDDSEIDITRRIERERGSGYRVNGQDVRARDVQLLFADLATGAHSTAIVSQGQIGQLIAAKPIQRRAVLEEAAGITGLHSRRHEAELRLRGAETNLERLDDVLQALESQFQGLQRQSRQAKRYRNLSDLIRKAEAMMFHLRWTAAVERTQESVKLLQAAEARVAELTGAAAVTSTAQAETAAKLAPLRKAEAEAAAAVQRHVIARNQLDAEEQRAATMLEQARARAQQIEGDLAREETLHADSAQALEKLEAEQQALIAADSGASEASEAAQKSVAEAEAAVAEAETLMAAESEKVTTAEAQRGSLDRRVTELAQRVERLESRLAATTEERAGLQAELGGIEALENAERAMETADQELAKASEAAGTAERALAEARAAEDPASEAHRTAVGEHDAVASEAAGLRKLLASSEADGRWPPVLDQLSVAIGMESALGAALGDDLEATLDPQGSRHWSALPPLDEAPALPAGASPLSEMVRGPDALARRLSQIGLLANPADGPRLQSALRPGQRLVSRDGDLWRWDGLTVAAGAESPAAHRLQQKNRLIELEDSLRSLEAMVRARAADLEQCQATTAAALEREQTARATRRSAFETVERARAELAQISDAIGDARAKLRSLEDAIAQVGGDLEEARTELAAAEHERATAHDPSAARQRLEELRSNVAALRGALGERRGECERLTAEQAARSQRLDAIREEIESWRKRAESAADQKAVLDRRLGEARTETEALAARPAKFGEERTRLDEALHKVEDERKAAADRLAEAEGLLAAADKELKGAEGALAEAREDRVRAEAGLEQAQQACAAVEQAVAERLHIRAEEALALSGHKESAPLPETEAIERRVERLLRERETMGAVNLRAEEEAEELQEQIRSMQSEREDLIAALGRLRQAISQLNREGRGRLLGAFETVNRHFQELFVRLFGGGKAYLSLVESDDPLEAGLEIMASPPGKRLQVLSLLSGGEQALTALALQFAVFLTNPAPICVLDEVDAPLDDNNVDRFCTLVGEMAGNSKTRFLVVTHHRLTMARMDRLFGVTMAERGVSQLASVDLQRAVRLRESA